jgi:hypothetical protein
MARNRYTFKNLAETASVPLSFRVTESVNALLIDRIDRLDDIANKTEALQDALVTWLMVEEYEERKSGESQA